MLVVSRARDETVMIGDDIEVTVLDVRGDRVRLGFTAPRDVPVHRKEVYDAIRRENRAAAATGAVYTAEGSVEPKRVVRAGVEGVVRKGAGTL
jgi:carbon storage regulator